ncbi:MAG: S41 family peptidase [Alphaproteobacteria bacterium]|nr:S41 family peptidase [Alphaproteobacteria bacterium]MBU0794354.1 S41 family peptidase [Alphaproteobacteria bacterium]MBU0876806.1 S41 family peptidase [Alphaproteobacteria bacterium]MBU1769776.1 S41 family peptidase [Alphaproteobacteria bacterium]
MANARRVLFLRSAAILGAIALVPASTSAVTETEGETYKQLDLFMDVFQRVRSNYVEQVDDATLIKGAIEGMLSSLDPHSAYLDVRSFENLRTQTEGSYGGLGLSVTMDEGVVKVIAPTDDTPASRAGIKAGDYITHIDGKLIYGGTLDEAVDKMRGPPNTTIKLTIAREGRDEPFDVELTRAIIDIKPVKWQVKDGVGIIKIVSFSADTGADVQSAIRGIDKSLGRKPTGYILDMRSNPGGLLDEAVRVSDAFLERGEIVSQRGRQRGDTRPYYARPGDDAQGLPVIVLIDAGSASASEIVAGALQDHNRALIMGERSFGKGSVQTLLPLSQDTALRLTTARYYTPSGKSVQEGGIEPDILVPQLSDPDYAKRPKYRESDLRRHLINEAKLDRTELESDTNIDPRFTATADELKEQGVEDFQLHYALQTIGRLTATPQMAASSPKAKR